LTFGETQHLRVYVPRAIRQLLEANGFRVLEVRGAPALENEAWPHPWFLRPFFLLDDILASVPSLAGTLIAAARRKE
jgi:hypothetical protein